MRQDDKPVPINLIVIIAVVTLLITAAVTIVNVSSAEGKQDTKLETLQMSSDQNVKEHAQITKAVDELKAAVKDSDEKISGKLDKLTDTLNTYMLEEARKKP